MFWPPANSNQQTSVTKPPDDSGTLAFTSSRRTPQTLGSRDKPSLPSSVSVAQPQHPQQNKTVSSVTGVGGGGGGGVGVCAAIVPEYAPPQHRRPPSSSWSRRFVFSFFTEVDLTGLTLLSSLDFPGPRPPTVEAPTCGGAASAHHSLCPARDQGWRTAGAQSKLRQPTNGRAPGGGCSIAPTRPGCLPLEPG